MMRRSRRKLLTAVALALSTTVVLALVPASADAGEAWDLFRATNRSRLHHGIRRVHWDKRMSEVAERHSRAMAERGDLFHTSDVSRYGRGCHVWGENIGWTTGGVGDLQRAFMASVEHRRNILARGFREVAVGAARTQRKLWVTVFFCA